MLGRASGRRAALSLAVLLAFLLTVPALAQQPYPPPPPDPDPGSGRVETRCEIDGTREIACEGELYLADSTVTIEIRRAGQPSALAPMATISLLAQQGSGNLVAAYTEQVDSEGEWDTEYQLPCDYTANKVRVRVSGRDSEDRPVTESMMLDVPESPGCTAEDPGTGSGGEGELSGDGAAPGGADEVLAAVDRNPDGSLAFTGRNLVLLVALALVLVALGAVMVRLKNSRGEAPIA